METVKPKDLLLAADGSPFQAALGYVGRPWPVFPLHSAHNGACTCGKVDCPRPAKHPRTPHGFKDATTDPSQVQEWWHQWPQANVAIATGSASGLGVVDLDAAKGGLEAWEGLIAQHGPVETLTVITGSGGRHLYFQAPEEVLLKSTADWVAPGIDTRAEGGYVVVPPSIHSAGHRYQWANSLPPAPLPDWLLNLWPKQGSHSQLPQEANGDEPILEGQRNATLTSLAGSMRRRGTSPESIKAALLAENEARCLPPLSEAEVLGIARSISRYPGGGSNHYKLATSFASDSPQNIPNQWPPPLEAEAFHGLAGEVVWAIEPHTEADPAAVLVNFLVAFGNAVGLAPYAIAEADRHGTNLFAVLVGETAKGRKGSSFGHVRELFYRVDSVWSGRIMGGLSSGEGLVWHVRDPIEKLEPVKEKSKPTGEGQTIIIDGGVPDKRLLCYEPEFASVLKVLGREGNTLSALLRQAWDSGTLRTLTKNNPAVATGTHISILGHITKEELLRYLNDTEAANGFANRFLWVCVRRSKVLPEGGGEPDYNALLQPLHEALERARRMGRLERDAEARKAWAEIYPGLSDGKLGLFGAVIARAEAQVLRLSVLYAALDGAEAIQLPHLMAALAVWEYCEASARYIFGDATGDPIADRILDSLRMGELSRTGISALFQRNISASRIDQALKLLLTAGKAHLSRQETEGRPTEVWAAA
jgi:hypothetical protein